MATAVTVEPGPTGVSSPSMVIRASACGRAQVDDQVRLVEQAAADRRIDVARHRLATDVTAMTRRPRCPRAARHLDRDRGRAAGGEDDHDVLGAEREVVEDDLGQAGHALDEHRLALAVGADDLGVERHRQLGDRVEPRVRAVAREHLLDRASASGPSRRGGRGRPPRSPRHTTGWPSRWPPPGSPRHDAEQPDGLVDPGQAVGGALIVRRLPPARLLDGFPASRCASSDRRRR